MGGTETEGIFYSSGAVSLETKYNEWKYGNFHSVPMKFLSHFRTNWVIFIIIFIMNGK